MDFEESVPCNECRFFLQSHIGMDINSSSRSNTVTSTAVPCLDMFVPMSSVPMIPLNIILESSIKFTKYLKESCCFNSDQHFFFNFFSKDDLVIKIFPK